MTLWEKFQGDFNAMSDDEIEVVSKEEEDKLNEAEEWLEAVSAWKAAGKPRATKAEVTAALSNKSTERKEA